MNRYCKTFARNDIENVQRESASSSYSNFSVETLIDQTLALHMNIEYAPVASFRISFAFFVLFLFLFFIFQGKREKKWRTTRDEGQTLIF